MNYVLLKVEVLDGDVPETVSDVSKGSETPLDIIERLRLIAPKHIFSPCFFTYIWRSLDIHAACFEISHLTAADFRGVVRGKDVVYDEDLVASLSFINELNARMRTSISASPKNLQSGSKIIPKGISLKLLLANPL